MQYVLLYIKLWLGFQVYSFWQNSVWHTTNMNGIFLQSFRPRRNTSRKQLTFNHHKTLLKAIDLFSTEFIIIYGHLWSISGKQAGRQGCNKTLVNCFIEFPDKNWQQTHLKKRKKNKQNQDQRHNITVTVLKNIFVKMSSNPWNDTCKEPCHLPF